MLLPWLAQPSFERSRCCNVVWNHTCTCVRCQRAHACGCACVIAYVRAWVRACTSTTTIFTIPISNVDSASFRFFQHVLFSTFRRLSIRHVRCYDTPTCQHRNISTSKHLNFAAFQHLNTSTLNFQHSNCSQLFNPLNFQHFNCSASQPFQHKVQLFNLSASQRVHTLISPCAK